MPIYMKDSEKKDVINFVLDAMESASKKVFDRTLNQILNDTASVDKDAIIYACKKVFTTRMTIVALGIREDVIYRHKRLVESNPSNLIHDVCNKVVAHLETYFNPAKHGIIIKKKSKNFLDYNHSPDNIKIAAMIRRAIADLPTDITGLEDPKDIFMKRRFRPIVAARKLVIYALTSDREYETTTIGLAFDLDHSTIIHNRNDMDSYLDVYPHAKILSNKRRILDFVQESLSNQIRNEAIYREQYAQ